MQQQMQQEQKLMMQRQAQMAEMESQAHQQRIQGFNQWVKSNASSTTSDKVATASSLPQSPQAFAAWYNTQKHNKARNKSYDPAYDQYRDFEKSQVQTSARRHTHKTGTTQTAQQTANAQVATQANQPTSQTAPASQVQQSAHQSSVLNQPSNTPEPRLAVATPNSAQTANPTKVSTTTASASTATGSTTTSAPATGSTTTHSPTTTAHQPAGTVQPINRLAAVGSSANRLPWAADQAIISHLRTAHARLQQADHDYQGHRARATSHIANAMRHLGGSSLSGLNMTASGMNAAPGQGQLPQAQSDNMVRDALFRLNMVQGQLTSRTSLAAHQGNARTQVAQAIQELNVALNVR
jgi:hypothetical protein